MEVSYFVKQNKLDSERQMLHVVSHMWNIDIEKDKKVGGRLGKERGPSGRGSREDRR
jgi:hypothetical protein